MPVDHSTEAATSEPAAPGPVEGATEQAPSPTETDRSTAHDVAEALVDGLGRLDLSDVSEIRGELDQVRSLLHDAVARLNSSFKGLSDDTDFQRKHLKSLILDMSGELGASGREENSLNFQSFVQHSSRLLTSFADVVTHFSKQSVQIAYRIDDMVDEMKAIFRLIEQVDAIAEDTNILAINAALEAVRAGEKGKGFGVVAAEVRTLSRKTKELNDSITDRMKDAESSIMTVRESVGHMASHDMSVAMNAKSELDSMLGRMETMRENVESTLSQIETFTERVDESASNAIMGLQFEDLTAQVLENAREKLDRVESAFEEVRSVANDHRLPLDERMKAVQRALEGYARECSNARAPAVGQSSLDEGEITFF